MVTVTSLEPVYIWLICGCSPFCRGGGQVGDGGAAAGDVLDAGLADAGGGVGEQPGDMRPRTGRSRRAGAS